MASSLPNGSCRLSPSTGSRERLVRDRHSSAEPSHVPWSVAVIKSDVAKFNELAFRPVSVVPDAVNKKR